MCARCQTRTNDHYRTEANEGEETPAERWTRMRAWVAEQLSGEARQPAGGT